MCPFFKVTTTMSRDPPFSSHENVILLSAGTMIFLKSSRPNTACILAGSTLDLYFKWIYNLNLGNKMPLRPASRDGAPQRECSHPPEQHHDITGTCSCFADAHGRHPANTHEHARMPGFGHLSLLTSGNERSG